MQEESHDTPSGTPAGGNPMQEEATFRRIMEEGEPDAAAAAASRLGHVLTLQGRTDEAEAALRRAIDLDPRGTPSTAWDLGRLLARRGRHEEAEAFLRQALSSDDPALAGFASLDLADLLSDQPGRDAEAEAAFRRALDATRADPNVAPEAPHHFGIFLIMRGRQEEAEAAFREAVAHEHPDASRDLAAVGVARLLADRQGGEQEAEAVLREALVWEDLPDRRAVLIQLGSLLAGQPGRQAEAEAVLGEARDEAGDDPYFGLPPQRL